MSVTYYGRCHCGSLTLRYTTALEPSQVSPRACDCSYCIRQGAMYVSDPQGRLELDEGGHRYRQGEQRADFVSCSTCAVLLAVVFEKRGAVNVRCLERFAEFGVPQVVSPQSLSPDQRLQRWEANWTPLC